MPRDWATYLTSTPTDAGRALVLQGLRLDEARRQLSETQYVPSFSLAPALGRERLPTWLTSAVGSVSCSKSALIPDYRIGCAH